MVQISKQAETVGKKSSNPKSLKVTIKHSERNLVLVTNSDLLIPIFFHLMV